MALKIQNEEFKVGNRSKGSYNQYLPKDVSSKGKKPVAGSQ